MNKTLRLVVALAVAILTAGCGLWDREPETKLFSDGEIGVSLRYPSGWDVSGFSTTVSPPRLVVASFPLQPDVVEGDCGGRAAFDALPPDGAAVLVIVWAGQGFPARPARFSLKRAKFGQYECFGPSHMLRFGVGNLGFQAHLVFGPSASAERRHEALTVLTTFQAISG